MGAQPNNGVVQTPLRRIRANHQRMFWRHEQGFVGVITRCVTVLVVPSAFLDRTVVMLVCSYFLISAGEIDMPHQLHLGVDHRIMGGGQTRSQKRQQSRQQGTDQQDNQCRSWISTQHGWE